MVKKLSEGFLSKFDKYSNNVSLIFGHEWFSGLGLSVMVVVMVRVSIMVSTLLG